MLHVADPAPEGTGSTVARTLAVMRALARPGNHRLHVIAARAGLPVPTTHRYLRALLQEGAVERCGQRGYYALTDQAPQCSSLEGVPAHMTGLTSPAVRAELVRLQVSTGQIALLYAPLFMGIPMRVCTEHAFGAHASLVSQTPVETQRALWQAPLDYDAAGLAILASLEDRHNAGQAIRRVREQGHAIGPSPLQDWDSIAVPLWRGPVVAGATTLLVPHAQIQRTHTRNQYAKAVMDTAAALSRQLTRLAMRHAG